MLAVFCIFCPLRWSHLTHWGRVTHICVGKLTIIGSDNGLSPGRRQVIIWTNSGILLIEALGTNFSDILIGIQIFSFKKMPLKMSSAKWRPFCLGLNVLMTQGWVKIVLYVQFVFGGNYTRGGFMSVAIPTAPQDLSLYIYIYIYIYIHSLLLLISMLWHRQAIFESKGDKLSSSAEGRIRTHQSLRHQIASRLNAHWQTDWAIEDQAKT